MSQTIPCAPNGDARWQQRTALDGRDYLLDFDWNQRTGHWSLSLADQDGVPITSSVTLVTSWPLLRGVVGTARPPGELVVIDTRATTPTLDPGFGDLGTRFLLIYLTTEDLEGL